ncbi:hypothetical protein HMSSN139_48750 [Paenibacillus sp. HMSSN-139]|nr:hypothetical protein HMSSN139_48750 [Paenibacillus sp. HMSSN-139]
MQMKKKRITALLTSFLSVALLLAACGGNGGNNAAQGAEPASAQSGNSQSEAGGNNAGTAAGGELQFIPAGDMSKLPAVAKGRTDTIIVGLTDPSGAFTPYFQQSGYDGNVSSLLYTPLVTVDDKGLPAPGLAESWEVSEDQLTYTYHLRKDLKFSDGSPMTADDVVLPGRCSTIRLTTGIPKSQRYISLAAKLIRKGKPTAFPASPSKIRRPCR